MKVIKQETLEDIEDLYLMKNVRLWLKTQQDLADKIIFKNKKDMKKVLELKTPEYLQKDTVFLSIDKNQNEILKLCPNGDIFVKGRLAENDKEVVDAMREFLISVNFLNK